MLTTQNLIKSLLFKNTTGYDLGSLSSIVNESNSKKDCLCVIALIYENSKSISDVVSKYDKIYNIVTEHNIKLPEEESLIKNVIDEESAGGAEGGSSDVMNTTSAIEPTVPRIKPRKKKDNTAEQ